MSKDQDQGTASSLLEPETRVESRSDLTGGGASENSTPPETEVVAKASRRRFTAAYKLRILEEVEGSTDTGGVGRILRREGLHSSHLANWRKARVESSMDGLERKRGRKPNPNKALERKMVNLERENQRLRADLAKVETILDVQGKVAGLLGFNLSDGSDC